MTCKIVPDMTYNVFGGTLNLALSIYLPCEESYRYRAFKFWFNSNIDAVPSSSYLSCDDHH